MKFYYQIDHLGTYATDEEWEMFLDIINDLLDPYDIWIADGAGSSAYGEEEDIVDEAWEKALDILAERLKEKYNEKSETNRKGKG